MDVQISHTIDNNVIKVSVVIDGDVQEYDIVLDENTIVNLYNSIMAKKYSSFLIRQNGVEYSFLVENRQHQPQPNIAYSPAVDGTPIYEVLGQPEKRWNFTLYVDTIEKYKFLNNLASNPICEVYFDEIEGWKQVLITSVSITRITTGHYEAEIEFVLLE
jgi:hypothetical protein